MTGALPRFLYHYTSIEVLALILANNTVRFTRLDLLNDPMEGQSRDLPGIGSFVFVSCWTGSEEESLPLWNLYTRDMRGCRVRLPSNPFDGKALPGSTGENPQIHLSTPALYQDGTGDGELSVVHSVYGPERVNYTSDEAMLRPSLVVEEQDDYAKFDALKIGLAKGSAWEFEQEWRYRINTSPEGECFGRAENEGGDRIPPFLDLQTHPPLSNSIDVQLARSSLMGLEVMLGPRARDGEKVIADALVGRFAAGGRVIRSRIQVR
jgi:hypothetical protein